MPDIVNEIAKRTKRSMSHEAGHALTAYDYGFGADEFLVEVANDPTGATYRGRIGLRFVSDEEIKKMDEAKKRCYGIVCAAGAAGEFVALGNIAQQNLHDGSKDRQLLARFTAAPIEEFIEDAKIIVGARREVHRKVTEYLETKFWEWIKAHPETPDGLYTVLDKQAIGLMFAQLDILLKQVREMENPKVFSFKGTIWSCSHSTGWMAFCQSGMKGKVTASTWKELVACIKSAVLSKTNETK